MTNEISNRTFTIKEYVLFKLDRNIAILGLIALGIIAVVFDVKPTNEKVLGAIIGALAVYIGGRGGNK